MSDDERIPVQTLEELDGLDERDMMHGYLAGYRGAPEPSIEMNRAYWHGWRNGMVDGGRMAKDEAQAILARRLVARERDA